MPCGAPPHVLRYGLGFPPVDQREVILRFKTDFLGFSIDISVITQ
jgi:hypothetical protein